jgi:hypothetical protein
MRGKGEVRSVGSGSEGWDLMRFRSNRGHSVQIGWFRADAGEGRWRWVAGATSHSGVLPECTELGASDRDSSGDWVR